ncbi:MAG: hypothetical protein PVH18_07430, partial [Chloroflexota bacterium]
MIDEIRRLESEARRLEMDANYRAQLLEQVAAYSQQFLDDLAEEPAHGPADGLALSDSPLTEDGIGIEKALAL